MIKLCFTQHLKYILNRQIKETVLITDLCLCQKKHKLCILACLYIPYIVYKILTIIIINLKYVLKYAFCCICFRNLPNSPTRDADTLDDADADLGHEDKKESHKVEGAVTPGEKQND